MLREFAGIGLLIGGLSLTGVAQSLASDLAVLTGGNLYLLLVLGALGALVMGMGMPITPCYIFLAMTFAPTLVNIGIDPMAAHLFFLYWGMLSFITPPVCIAVFAASTLAGSSPMKTGYTAMRLGVVIFIIPFFFVLNPNLIGHGPWPGILESVLTAVVGALLVATGLGGHALRIGKLGLAARVIFFAAGLLLLYPWWLTEVLGAALALVAILWAYSESGLARASHRNKA